MKNQSFTILLILQLLIFSFTPSSLFAQEWMEPVNVSNMSDHLNQTADLEIDHSGLLHVVWTMRMSSSWWKIMYSYSDDDGLTWSAPLDILQNTDLWMSSPKIACDSKNHLYVSYTYNKLNTPEMLVKMVIYDGYEWSDPILVSEGMPGSDYNKVLVDHKDRVFVFWGYQETSIKYRIFQNNTFGEIMEPFYNSLGDYYYLYHASIDTNNKIHWIGYTTEGMPSGTFAHAYFILEPDLNEWSVPQNISIVKAEIGNDIDLSINGCPEVVIREDTAHWPTPNDDITFFRENNGINWMPTEPVANTLESQQYQQIAVDQNNEAHIVENQKTIIGYKMVHYKKECDKWSGYIIDSTTNFCIPTKLLFHNDKLYLVYFKDSIPGTPDDDIFFTKYDIVTGQKEQSGNFPIIKIYPNPFRDNISIEFETNKQQHVDLSVFDMNGKQIITLISETKPQGMYRQLWNGKDKKGKRVSAGQYLVRLKLGRNTTTGLVEIVK